MENGGFQSQVLSVMEVLAKAAVAEINRRVDDSCALLRLEVSQSRRDIALLKRKCEAMEAELRRTRMRAKRRAAERLFPLNKERPRTDWDRRTPSHPQPEAADEAERVRVKEEDGLWKNSPQDKPTSGPEEPCFQAHRPVHTVNIMDHYPSAEKPNSTRPALDYDTFPERLNQNQNGQEIVVKLEQEEPDENAAPLDSDHRFMTQEGDRQLCSNKDTGESNFSRAGRECEQISTVDLQEMGLKSVVVSATRMKRRSRMFGCKTPQPDEGHSTLSRLNSVHQSPSPPQSQDPYRNSAPQARDPNEVLTAATPAASALRACSRASFSLARRMRTPWTSGISEKRFNCTYCDKSFMRFSQLKEHQRSHTGEKPFSCLLCGRSFTKQCNLIRHAVVHSGEKPYECSLCGKCFTQRSSLKSHQKTAH